ncbi:diacylglycerol O-acyltransferase 1 [Coemansia spiralis]|uniref:Diacylglycerol O-acyltransferase n=2 Tax=Coemansia TaxID=4863 RepID=A0A9W8G9U9_9FUNG|nr:diacylglycerol acyltransferase-domain-containing protein [Coemansia spiralis]KAJ1994752.1 diacylglycerol O-acyltransferase 1 [Coemansia umbellata]KAJ2624546.1 diacylglycerol O-acyltransferase 1 [Coemansia sp. RSA 1358]KAJ2679486.1 diacylglycerol O-acyltransferase 1 [Coemansia spiralis]
MQKQGGGECAMASSSSSEGALDPFTAVNSTYYATAAPSLCEGAIKAQQGFLGQLSAFTGAWAQSADISEEWSEFFERVSDFLQETLTTAMVTLWATSPVLCAFLYVYLFIYVKTLRVVLGAYLVFCFFDPRPYDGVGRRFASVRKLPIWDHVNAYFQPKLVFEEPLDPRKQYVFGSHPHGVIGYVSQLIAGTTGLGIEEHFPGLVVRGVTMPVSFSIPFFRDYVLAMGCLSCDRGSIRRILKDRHHKLRQSLLIVVGGAEESMLAHENRADLVLLKRKGFVREAIRAGCDLVPVYNFNENSIYKLMPNGPGTFARKFELAIKDIFGYTLLLFHGRNIFFTPYRTQLTSVVGKPIPVCRSYDPTSEEVDHYHSLYVEELSRLYAKYKLKYAPNDADIRFVA